MNHIVDDGVVKAVVRAIEGMRGANNDTSDHFVALVVLQLSRNRAEPVLQPLYFLHSFEILHLENGVVVVTEILVLESEFLAVENRANAVPGVV